MSTLHPRVETQDAFRSYVRQQLIPTRKPDDMVILSLFSIFPF